MEAYLSMTGCVPGGGAGVRAGGACGGTGGRMGSIGIYFFLPFSSEDRRVYVMNELRERDCGYID